MFTPRRLQVPVPAYLYDNSDDEKTPTTRIINAFCRLVTPTKDALMAFRAKYLVCYYCNVKSTIKFHPGITSFVCPCCDAENFLDQHGDITDPPVSSATEYNGNSFIRRRLSIANTIDPTPSKATFQFCNKCSLEQRLKVAAIAGFEGDSEIARQDFIRNTEIRYPGICEECRPGANEALKLSFKTAKQDFFGHALKKTREQKSNLHYTSKTARIGRFLWFTAIITRILWSICSIVLAAPPSISNATINTIINTTLEMVTSDTCALLCIVLTFSAAFWNPKYNGSKPLTHYLTRYTKWYLFQFLACGITTTTYYINQVVCSLQTAIFTMSLHASLIILYILIAKLALQSIESSRKTPNWRNPPLINEASTSPQPSRKGPETMFSALLDIQADPFVDQKPLDDTAMDWTPTYPSTPATTRKGGKRVIDFQIAPPRFFAPQPHEKEVDDVAQLFQKKLSVSSTNDTHKGFPYTTLMMTTATIALGVGVWVAFRP